MKKRMRLAVLSAAVLALCYGQSSNCQCGGSNCVVFTLSCSGCGLSVCSGTALQSEQTDRLDTCKSSTVISCQVAKNPDGSNMVCGNSNQVTQCYQRNIGVTGWDCDTAVWNSFVLTTCCNG